MTICLFIAVCGVKCCCTLLNGCKRAMCINGHKLIFNKFTQRFIIGGKISKRQTVIKVW